jgi:hypothetical protein
VLEAGAVRGFEAASPIVRKRSAHGRSHETTRVAAIPRAR